MQQKLQQLIQQVANARTMLAEMDDLAHQILADHKQMTDDATAFCLANAAEFAEFRQDHQLRPRHGISTRGLVGMAATGIDPLAGGESVSTRGNPTSPTIAAGPVVTAPVVTAAERAALDDNGEDGERFDGMS